MFIRTQELESTERDARLGFGFNVVAAVVSLTLTVTLLGLFPTGIVPPATQFFLASVFVTIVVIVLSGIVIRDCLRRRGRRLSLASVLILITVSAASAWLVRINHDMFHTKKTAVTLMSFVEREGMLETHRLADAYASHTGKRDSAIVVFEQWLVNRGVMWTVLMFLSANCGLQGIRSRVRFQQHPAPPLPIASLLKALAHQHLAISAWSVALGIAVCTIVEPSVLRAADSEWRHVQHMFSEVTIKMMTFGREIP